MQKDKDIEIEIDWIKCPRNELDDDSFQQEYRGFEIYFSIPNGRILSAGIREKKERGKCLLFNSEFLDGDFYCESQWHLDRCKEKIDSILEKRAE